VEVPGFQSSAVFSQIKSGIDAASAEQKAAIVKKTKAVFQFDVKSSSGQVQTWTLNLKTDAGASTGAPASKPDIVISISDKDFVDLASGKLNGQKAFMGGKLKIKGNMMLATSTF
ncbi:SCP2 sterol-binding domain-containing protein, partial [Powellomyces hirtus]